MASEAGNTLYYGDNLDVLRRHVKDETVDLVYLDPPFNSNADYNVLFEEHGEKAAAQVRAFEDTWEWNTESRAAYEDVVEAGGPMAETMRAFHTMLGGSDILAYLAMMAPRLAELHRVLKPGGALWLHCDPTASHYLKLLLDAAFGPKNFVGEVIWKRTSSHNDPKRPGKIHDVLLYFAKGAGRKWNRLYQPLDPTYVEKVYVYEDARGRYRLGDLTGPGVSGGVTGQEWRGVDPTRFGRHWRVPPKELERLLEDGRIQLKKDGKPSINGYKMYLADSPGMALQSIWADIPNVTGISAEKLGYPTQKPIKLLSRIVEVSSDPGDLVLDPFCGCGTAIDAAQALGRRWIGIDITHLSISLIKHRLVHRYGADIVASYRVIGEPTTVEDAAVLAGEDPFQFQAWALGLVGARVAGSDKKGGDKGIDGRLYFHDSLKGGTRQVIFSVKAGRLVPAYVDALWGVLEREKAEIGVLISFSEPTPGMRARAADAGFYESPWGKHPRLQLITVGELLDGKGIDYPHVTGGNVTHRRARRAREAAAETMELFGSPDSVTSAPPLPELDEGGEMDASEPDMMEETPRRPDS